MAPAHSTHARPTGRQWRSVAPPLAAVLVLTALGGDTARDWLEYERAAILSGELWRLVTGHLVHAGFNHLAMNLGGLLLLWGLAPDALTGARGFVVLLWLLLGTGLALLLMEPALHWYVGLSGVLHGVALVTGWRLARRGQRIGWGLLAALAAKLVWEAVSPISPSARLIGVPVIESAHFWGASAAALAMLSAAAASFARSIAIERR